jgi:hypothetical protein
MKAAVILTRAGERSRGVAMKFVKSVCVGLGIAVLVLLPGMSVPVALAQGMAAPASSVLPPASPSGPASQSDGITGAFVAFVGLLVVGLLVVGVKMLDRKRKREEEAVQVQSQISDALLRDRMLAALPVTPTAHVPIWGRSPATIELHGHVPAVELREAVLRVAEREASRILSAYQIQDGMTVAPPVGAHAA